jgi:hypothetical protein
MVDELREWACVTVATDGVDRLSFNASDAVTMKVRALLHSMKFYEFQLSEAQRMDLIKYANNEDWIGMRGYLIEKGLIRYTYKRVYSSFKNENPKGMSNKLLKEDSVKNIKVTKKVNGEKV